MTEFKNDVSIIGDLTINGPDDGSITMQAPSPGTDLIFGYDTSGAPNAWSINQSGAGFYLVFGYNAVNPQIVMGAPSGAGTCFFDTDFARPLNLNTLPTGTGQGVGGRGLVTVGQAGLSVGSLNAGAAPNLQLTTVDGGTDWNVFLGSPGNFDDWFRIAEVGGANANELVVLPNGQGLRVQNGAAGSPGHGFLNGSNYGMFLSGTNDALGFSIAGTSAFDIESDRTLSVSGTTDYELLVTDDDDIPNAIWVQNEITGQSLGEHVDVDVTTVTPVFGNFLYWDTTNWIPSESATARFTINDGTCVANFIDTTGLDFCNTQIGPTAGSAFYIGQRALGTIAVPTAVGSGTKLAGYSAAGYDGTDYYVTSEISFFTTEAFNGTDGGAEMRFLTTPNGSKSANVNLTIEEDGTLNVAGQTDYELKVTDDDDIPNKRYADRRQWDWSVARNAANQGNQFLRRQNGTPTNLTPYIVPVDATIDMVSAGHQPTDPTNPDWDFRVLVNGVVQVTLFIDGSVSSSSIDASVSFDVSAGDEITMDMANQTAVVDYPAGSVHFTERYS